jgi:hypothetical protein
MKSPPAPPGCAGGYGAPVLEQRGQPAALLRFGVALAPQVLDLVEGIVEPGAQLRHFRRVAHGVRCVDRRVAPRFGRRGVDAMQLADVDQPACRQGVALGGKPACLDGSQQRGLAAACRFCRFRQGELCHVIPLCVARRSPRSEAVRDARGERGEHCPVARRVQG